MPETRDIEIPQQLLNALLPLETVLNFIEQTNSEGGITGMIQTSTGRVLELRSGRGMTLPGVHIHNHAEIQTFTAAGRTHSRIADTGTINPTLNILNISSGDSIFVARRHRINRSEGGTVVWSETIPEGTVVGLMVTAQLQRDLISTELIVRVRNSNSINPIIPFEYSFIVEEGINEVTVTRGIHDPHADLRPFFEGTIYFDSESAHYGSDYPAGTRNYPVNNISALVNLCENYTAIHRIEILRGDTLIDLNSLDSIGLGHYELIDNRPAMEIRADGTFIIRGNLNVTIDRTMDAYQLFRKLDEIKITDKNKFALADLIIKKVGIPKKRLVKTKRKIRLNNDINEKKQD